MPESFNVPCECAPDSDNAWCGVCGEWCCYVNIRELPERAGAQEICQDCCAVLGIDWASLPKPEYGS
jgi:hypothetical protein